MNLIDGEYDRRVIGILSHSKNKYKYSHFTKIMEKYIEEDVGVIYLCNYLRESKYIEDHFKSVLEDKYEKIIEKKQIRILNRDYIQEKESISESFNNFILSQIKYMEEKSFKNIRIYVNVDKHINKIPKEDLYTMFQLIATLSNKYDIRVILRLFMDEITNFEFFSLMSESGYFVVEDTTVDDFLLSHYPEIVTSSNLFLDSTAQQIQPPYAKKDINNIDSFNKMTDEVSHDLKNIFATISGYSQLAMLKTESTEVNNYLKIILNNCLDSHSIFEKFHNHSQDLNIKSGIYSFNNLVMDSSEMAFNMKRNKLHLDNSQIALSYSLNSQNDVCCDKNQIKQVIMNIIDNGIHALNGKGNIIINTYDKKNDVILEIIDNGIGIDEFTQSKIFEPYFTTKKDSGMGLGLDIAKRTLKSHGATICVESRLGVGTKFIIVFPAIDKELNLDSKESRIYNNA